MTNLAALYRHRFDASELPRKRAIWRILCRDFFQSYVDPKSTVLDLACGYGDFIENIDAARKIAVDLNPDSPHHLSSSVEFYLAPATEVSSLPCGQVDVVFTSNFFEHLPDKATLDRVLQSVFRLLRPGGKLLVLGPNIRYLPGEYWDFYDHHLALSDRSLSEGLALNGYEIEEIVPRFLPYTTQSRLPQHPLLISLYLRVKFAWRILGKQFFIVARKPL